jgi:flagellar FliL protein
VPEENASNETATPEKPASSMIKWVVLVVVGIILIAAGGWFWIHRSPAATKPEPPKKDEAKVKSVLHLETFVINLADADEKSYLRIGIDLGLAQETKKKEGEGPAEAVPLVRDVIVGVLSVCDTQELLTPAGKAKLKTDLLGALRQRAPELHVEEIYFTEFLIQR